MNNNNKFIPPSISTIKPPLIPLPLKEKSMWQSIETAPKDGSHILLYWPKTGEYPTRDGYHVEGARWLSEAECVEGRRYWEPHFVSTSHEQLHFTGMTHWMPLSKPNDA